MVRDMQYVTLNCKYRDLQIVLHSTKLKSLPLVESAGETTPQPRGSQTCHSPSRWGLSRALSLTHLFPPAQL